MTLKQIIYRQITEGERMAAYQFYEEIWYVVKWNQQTYIHYTMKINEAGLKILYYLSANTYSPKWKCQTQEIKLNDMNKRQDSE